MKILAAYDGTIHAKKALAYGINKVRDKGGELLVVQVFDPSLFIDYDAGPKAGDLARAEAAGHLKEARLLVSEQAGGVATRFLSEEGDASAIINRLVHDETIDLVLVPQAYKKKLRSTLSCPVIVVPGTVVVPVDNTGSAAENIAMIAAEAVATGSQVLLVGIVPIHLYSREEKQELEQVKKDTTASLGSLKKMLKERGLNVSEELRSGYTDLEILRAAEGAGASLIILPTGGATPSELSKAAAILLDEPYRPLRHFVLVHEAGNA
jgi:nucleotide-binding universal stress UspA family protein